MTKKMANHFRLDALESKMDQVIEELRRNADIQPSMALVQNPRIAKTVDDGSYPSEDDGTSADSFALPIVFQDGSYSKTTGPVAVSLQPRSGTPQQHALFKKWVPPLTEAYVFHQDRRYWALEGGGSTDVQFCLEAFATLGEKMSCSLTGEGDVRVNMPLEYVKHGIFQKEWKETEVGTAPMTYADGTAMKYADGSDKAYASAASGEMAVWNRFGLCGEENDLVLLGFGGLDGVGNQNTPYIKQVLHKCFIHEEVFYDSDTCDLKKWTWLGCIMYSETDKAETPDPADALTLIDFQNLPMVTEVTYDPSDCSIYETYYDVCTIFKGGPTVQKVMDLRNDIVDDCCPCPDACEDCTLHGDPIRGIFTAPDNSVLPACLTDAAELFGVEFDLAEITLGEVSPDCPNIGSGVDRVWKGTVLCTGSPSNWDIYVACEEQPGNDPLYTVCMRPATGGGEEGALLIKTQCGGAIFEMDTDFGLPGFTNFCGAAPDPTCKFWLWIDFRVPGKSPILGPGGEDPWS